MSRHYDETFEEGIAGMTGSWLATGALVLTLAATVWMCLRAVQSDPDGQRRRLAIAGSLVTLGVAQSIPAVYETVDSALGGVGVFYLIAHIGLAIAAAFICASVSGVLVVLRVSNYVRVDVLLYPAVAMFSVSLLVRWVATALRDARCQRDLTIAA